MLSKVEAMLADDATWRAVELIAAALLEPPTDSRAAARSGLMRELQRRSASYYLDWEIIGADGGNPLSLLNPFESKPAEAEAWLADR